MATIRLRNGTTVTVPDKVAESYTSRGRVNTSPVPAEQPHGLDTMTVADLRQHAERHGIDIGSAKLKADIRAAIDAAGE